MAYNLTPSERRARAQARKQQSENRRLYSKYLEAQKAMEIERESAWLQEKKAESEKNNQNFFTRAFSTIGDLAANVLTGAVKGLEGIYDLGAGIVGAVGGIFDKDFQDGVKEHISYDWTSETIGNPLQEALKYSYLKDGGIIENVASGIGQMLPAVAVSVATGGLGAPAAVAQGASLLTLGASAAGNSTEEAFNDGAGYYQGLGYGLVSGGVEVATEKMFGGATKALTGAGLLDGVTRSVADTGIKRIAKNALEEGAEEIVSELVNPLARSIYKGKDALSDYASADYWKGVGQAGVVGSLTALAYSGTVGYGMSKAGVGYVGKEADIADSLTEISSLKEKGTNLQAEGKLNEQTETKIADTVRRNYQNIENVLKKTSTEKRAKLIEKFSLDKAFNSEGAMSEQLSSWLNVTPTAEQTNTDGGEKPSSELASPKKEYYSFGLRGSEQTIQSDLQKMTEDRRQAYAKQSGITVEEAAKKVADIKVFDGEMSEQAQEHFTKMKKGLNILNKMSGTNISFVVTEANDVFNGTIVDDKTMYIGADTFENDTWAGTLVHEYTHLAEGSEEYNKLFNYLASDDIQVDDGKGGKVKLWQKAQASVLSQNYGFTEDQLKKIVEKANSGEALTEQEAKYYDAFRSEVGARMTEYLLGNETFIDKVVARDSSIARKFITKIQNLIKMFKRLGSESKAEFKQLKKAENLYLAAARKAGNQALVRKILKAREERGEQPEETSGEVGQEKKEGEKPKKRQTKKQGVKYSLNDGDVSESSLADLERQHENARKTEQEAKKKLDAIPGFEEQKEKLNKVLGDKTSTNEAINAALDEYSKWEKESGYGAAYREYQEANRHSNELSRESERTRERLAKKLLNKKYSAEEINGFVQKAVRRFHTTPYLNRASYLLTTDSMLDFSDGQGYRVQDHREISEVLDLPDYADYSTGMIIFMNMGNIRLQSYGIDISALPNEKQFASLRGIVSKIMAEYDEFIVDFSKPNGDTDGSITYPKSISTARIVSDIKKYFETGELPDEPSGISQFRYSLKEGEESPYRGMYPKWRGELTKEKIVGYLKDVNARNNNNVAFARALKDFDSAEEVYNNIYYHGTGGYIPDKRSIRPSVALPKNVFRGGGYDQSYFAISVSKSKNVASSFTGTAYSGTLYTILLKKGAKVISMPSLTDSIELEDYIVDLWKDGVDAVKLGDWNDKYSEQELAIINPAAIVVGDHEYYRVFNKPRFENLTLDEVRTLYKKSLAAIEAKDWSSVRFSLKSGVETDSEGKTLTPAQKEYFKDSKVIDNDGNLLVVYHGTMSGEFTVFDASYANVESNMGAGFYFSSSYDDVNRNYEEGGQDLEAKIERLAEKIEAEEDIDYEEAKEKARKQLSKSSKLFEVYLDMKNPAYVGGNYDSSTYLFEDFFDYSDIQEEDYDSEDEYWEARDERVEETIQELVDKVDRILSAEGITGYDGWEQVLAPIGAFDGGVTIEDLKTALNETESLWDCYDSDGKMATTELLRAIIEALGYDGIIDNSVVDKFGYNSGRTEYMEGIDEETRHYIVFKPEQIKLTSNLNPTSNRDIRFSLKLGGETIGTNGRYAFDTEAEKVLLDISAQNDIENFLPEGLSEEFIKAIKNHGNFAYPRLYRGMEAAEFENIKKNGYIKSNGDYNFSNQQGETFFSHRIREAFSYATGFAPSGIRELFFEQGKPAYIVEVGNYGDLNFKYNSVKESSTKKEIDVKYITRILELRYNKDTQKVTVKDVKIDGMNSAKDDFIHGEPIFVQDKTTGQILYAVQDEEGYETGAYISGNEPSVIIDYNKLKDAPQYEVDFRTTVGNISGNEADLIPYKPKRSVKFSLKDSQGRTLSEGQRKYFKNSQALDESGNLLVLYHGGFAGTVFSGRGKGFTYNPNAIYLTDDRAVASAFARGGDIKELYALIKNPLIIDADGNSYMDIPIPDDAPQSLKDYFYDTADADNLPVYAEEYGYDGVIIKNVREGVGGDAMTEVIALRSNQVKLTSNTNPTANEDIRFSLKDDLSTKKYFAELTDGQVKKLLADSTKLKVYSKVEAEGIVNNIISNYLDFGEKYGVVSGKTKKQAIEMLWRGLNTADPGRQMKVALDIAEYIIQNSVMESMYDDIDTETHTWTISLLKPYLHSINLSHIKGEIKYRYGNDNSAYLLWGKRKGEKGLGADQIAMELEEQGMKIDAINEAEIFLQIDSAYRSAVAALKNKAKTLLSSAMSSTERKALKQQIAREVLLGFTENGKPSKLSKIIDKYRAQANVWKKAYYEERSKNKVLNRLLDKVQKLKDIKLGTFLNASQFKSDIFKGSIEKLANIKYRGNLNEAGTRKIVASLSEWYVKENPMLEGVYEDEVADMLRSISEGEGKLTVDELKTLENVVDYFKHFVETYNKVYRNGEFVDAQPIAQNYVKLLHENKSVKVGWFAKLSGMKYFKTFADPMTVARRMDMYESGFYTEMLERLREGAVGASVMEMEMREPLEEFYKKNKKYLKELSKRAVKYQGKDIPLSQALLLYMTLNREQAIRGLAQSGFTYTEEKETVRINGFAENYEGEELTIEQMKEMAKGVQDELSKQFSELDKEYISIAEKLFNETCKQAKKETDIKRKGYSNALEDYYVPIRRAYIAHNVDTSTFADEMNRVSNASFNKDTVKGAKNELYIEALDSVLDRHIRAVAQYANLSLAIDEYNKLFNLDIGDNPNKPKSVRTESVDTWREGDSYFKKLISDIQGIPVVKGEGAKFMSFIRGGYAKFQLGANPKVWVTQLSSFASAGSILDLGSITRGLSIKTADVDEYCPLAKLRNNDNTVALAQGVLDKVGKVGNALMIPIGKVDRFVVKKLFGACQVQVEKDSGLKIGTKENKVKAGELLKKVILETQQNAMATERSAAMRSGNELMKTLTMFTADSMKVIGRVIDSVGELSVLKAKLKATTDTKQIAELNEKIKQANKKARRAIASLVASAVFMALIAQLFRTLYNKDDDDDNIVLNMTVDAIGNLFGGLPIIKDIYARFMEGYDLDNYAYSAINNIFDSAEGIFDMVENIFSGEWDSKELAKNAKDLLFTAGQILGLPTRNIYNIGYGLIKRFSPSTAYKIDDMFYNQHYRTDLNKAIEKDDEEMIATIVGIMLDDNIGGITNSSVRKELDNLVKAGYNVIPKSVGNSVTYEGEEHALTSRQVKEFNAIYSTANEALASLVTLSQYTSATDEVKAKAVNFVFDTYYNLALQDFLGVELESKNVLFAEAIDIEKLAIIIAMARALTADMDKKGNVISGTRKAKVQSYINSLKLTVAQKYMIMGYLGYTNTKGEAQVKAYINRLKLTKSEKKKLLQYSGYSA